MKTPALSVRKVEQGEHRAIIALSKGEATPVEQQLALAVIVKKLAATHDLTYVPDKPDQTAFFNGRSFVGQEIIRLINTPPSKQED